MKTSILIIFTTLLWTITLTHANHHHHDNSTEEESTWKITYDLIVECSQKPSMVVCLKLKAVKFLDKAVISKDPFPLMEYITFSPDPNKEVADQNEELRSEEEIEASLPRSLDDQSGQLDQMIQDKVSSILQRRTLQLTIPMDFEGIFLFVSYYLLGAIFPFTGLQYSGAMYNYVPKPPIELM